MPETFWIRGAVLIGADRFAATTLRGAGTAMLDLDVALAQAAHARTAGRGPRLILRIERLDDVGSALDAAVARLRPDAVALGGEDASGRGLQHLGALLAVAEAEAGLVDGAVKILALVETGAALLQLASLAAASGRLAGLGWNAERFSQDIGAVSARQPDGRLIEPCRLARGLTLAAAAAAGVPAIDTIAPGLPSAALREEAQAALHDGFAAKFAADDAQAAIIAAVFER